MKVLTTTIARWLFALPFAILGLNHFLHPSDLVPLVPVPGGLFWVYFVGACLIAGAIGIGTKFYGRYAAFGLALLMLTFILTIHVPGLMHNETQTMSMINLFKDLGLGAGALTWAGLLEPTHYVTPVLTERHA
ncbi:MAG TPA: DoxX family membrane protein [Polyangiaceae bacterium]|nr:DoxX family membrane protein [Polyangiaceae bacterium]